MSTGLGAWYAGTPVDVDREPVSTRVELARRLAERERAAGRRPTVLFTDLVEHPGRCVLGNPYPRGAVLTALGVDHDTWLPDLAARLSGASPGWAAVPCPPGFDRLSGLADLPVVQHRPGDAGPYVTAGVGVTTRPDGTGVNLGVYRIQVVSGDEGRIFLDPRTDGHRNLTAWLAAGRPMPISVFLGANPAHLLVAASRLPAEGDDYDVVGRLLGRRVEVTGSPPVPVEATHVIGGHVLGRTAEEGPFGEFKGYYVDARRSNVLRVDHVRARPGAAWPTIVAGAESGLTMMSLQNEYLMYAHLTGLGFPVRSVRYPLSARGEFLALVTTDEPTHDVLEAAMRFDVRTKVVLCGPDLTSVWQSVATFGFGTRVEPYRRKGVVEGERIGLVLDIPPAGRPVEY
ncbi:UbiD family decarboxylase [Saccharothrix australiensis]|uniref:UbiD family decarboxylase n=1 Tax=Saccharothrix australiensis TaxID=2072 RepID=UPI001FE8D7C9|nr:UbiD family decarboxylase [Saccharothrix australiensis]